MNRRIHLGPIPACLLFNYPLKPDSFTTSRRTLLAIIILYLKTNQLLNPFQISDRPSFNRFVQSTTSAQVNSNRCNSQPDCGCEQKYKWHRLLVLDPSDSHSGVSKGLFMDWFLFPSNCVCRCKPGSSVKHFLRTMATT